MTSKIVEPTEFRAKLFVDFLSCAGSRPECRDDGKGRTENCSREDEKKV